MNVYTVVQRFFSKKFFAKAKRGIAIGTPPPKKVATWKDEKMSQRLIVRPGLCICSC